MGEVLCMQITIVVKQTSFHVKHYLYFICIIEHNGGSLNSQQEGSGWDYQTTITMPIVIRALLSNKAENRQ